MSLSTRIKILVLYHDSIPVTVLLLWGTYSPYVTRFGLVPANLKLSQHYVAPVRLGECYRNFFLTYPQSSTPSTSPKRHTPIVSRRPYLQSAISFGSTKPGVTWLVRACLCRKGLTGETVDDWYEVCNVPPCVPRNPPCREIQGVL